jgi:Carboxypeptidase regulatory-like domain
MKTLARYLTHTIRKRNVSVLAFVIALGIAMYCSSALAQSGAGSIQGTVTDPSGAVIAGASVHVVQQGTNVAADTKTNDVGFYQVPGLFTGTYVVTVTAPGMKTYNQTIDLLVSQTGVVNPVMAVGAVSQQVNVAANAVQLTDTADGTITSTLENARINQLPMNGRLLLTLTQETTPGLEQSGGRLDGLMPEALLYVADGAPLSDRNYGGEQNTTQDQLPDPDSIQEVQVVTMDGNALYDTPGTAVITTKSGTNQLHGTFFETARNNGWGIAKARQNAANFAAPKLVRNEFGASAGGPIVLPHIYHGKDKSFWFFSYEKYALASDVTQEDYVPSTAWRNGDFSGAYNSSGVLQTIYDPTTTKANAACVNNVGAVANNPACRTQFDYNGVPNTINPALISPLTKLLYAMSPTPSPSLANVNPLVAQNYIWPGPTHDFIPTVAFRLDHDFNEKNKTYLTYRDTLQNYIYPAYAAGPPATVAATVGNISVPAGLNAVNDFPGAEYAGSIGYTHIFSPTFYSETVLSQQWMMVYLFNGGNPNFDYEAQWGLPNNLGQTGSPAVSTGLVETYPGDQDAYGLHQILSTIDENLTKTVGRHQMQFGGRFYHERFNYDLDRQEDQVAFAAQATGLLNPSTGTTEGDFANAGQSNADFYLGTAYDYSVSNPSPHIHFHDMEIATYFQDNYHVSQHLTVNIGVRYEALPAVWYKWGTLNGFDLKNDAMVTAAPVSSLVANGFFSQAIVTNMENDGTVFETPQQAGMPSSIMKSYDLNFSPRVGIAYQPFGGKYGTVIRGGWGRYIYPIPTRNIQTGDTGEPFVTTYGQNWESPTQSPDGLANWILRNNYYNSSGGDNFTIAGLNSGNNVINTTSTNAVLPGYSVTMTAPDYGPDTVTEVNATIEQALKGNSALRLSWVWTHSSHLDDPFYFNNAMSSYVWEMNTGTAPPNGGASVIGTSQQNTYASTALGPYNQTTYGTNDLQQKDGWSNDNALQANYQRLFHHGIAYQIMYVWSKPFRVGGNSTRDGIEYPVGDWQSASVGTMTSPWGTVTPPALPPKPPTGTPSYADWHSLNVFEQYQTDSAIPKQHIQFNGIVDLPFGTGKRFLGNSNRFLNELVGGYQLAGDGQVISQDFVVASSNWGATNPLHVYKHAYPITDCTSGACRSEYLWYNGYISPKVIAGAGCTTNCISGLPANYQNSSGLPTSPAYLSPVDNNPSLPNFGTNDVQVTLSNGSVQTVAYAPGPATANPYAHSYLNGPYNYEADLSLFKLFPITERFNLRVNVDAFNFLNIQGYANPNTTSGEEIVQPGGVGTSSYWTPRQLQFSMRLSF